MTKILFKPLTKCFLKQIAPETIVFMKHEKTRDRLCQLPYPNRSKGCPNYNKPLCPPNTPLRRDILTSYDYFALVWIKFDFSRYLQEMTALHAGESFWTPDRLKSLLYWQNRVKPLLKKHILQETPEYDEIFGCGSGFTLPHHRTAPSMEAVGIYVFSTLKRNKIHFMLKPTSSSPPLSQPAPYVLLVSLLTSNHPFKSRQRTLLKF